MTLIWERKQRLSLAFMLKIRKGLSMNNIVFDMGNVLTIYDQTDYIREYVDTKEALDIIKKQVCASVEWICMDRGTMTDEEAVSSICRRVPENLHRAVESFIREFRIKQEPNPPMENLIRRLKKAGYGLYLMSNTSHRFRRFSKNILSISYMNGIWISCERGYLKPEKEAYIDFFQYMDLEPEECFFVDDSPANIEAGMRFGMKGCVYHQDIEELERNLKEAGFYI